MTDERAFGRLPPCQDPRFDHRSCDYWENEARGSKASRPSWWQATPARPTARSKPADQPNPFAPGEKDDDFNPFARTAVAAAPDPDAGDDPFVTQAFNPFAPAPTNRDSTASGPTKLGLLRRGLTVFGSYAKVLLLDDQPAAYAQFGPLSAYPRAQQIRGLYPRLPQSPLPAVITCIAVITEATSRGISERLIDAVCTDLSARGFSAVEAYPDLTLQQYEASAAYPAFWISCDFDMAIDDERYPVMRRPLS